MGGGVFVCVRRRTSTDVGLIKRFYSCCENLKKKETCMLKCKFIFINCMSSYMVESGGINFFPRGVHGLVPAKSLKFQFPRTLTSTWRIFTPIFRPFTLRSYNMAYIWLSVNIPTLYSWRIISVMWPADIELQDFCFHCHLWMIYHCIYCKTLYWSVVQS